MHSLLKHYNGSTSHHSPTVTPAQDFLERPPEIIVEYCVDNRIQGTVAVTEPKEKFKEGAGDAAGFTKGSQRVGKKKGEPADDKDPDDHSQDEGETLLAILSALPAAPLDALTRLELRDVVSRFDLAQLGLAFGLFLLHGAGIVYLVV